MHAPLALFLAVLTFSFSGCGSSTGHGSGSANHHGESHSEDHQHKHATAHKHAHGPSHAENSKHRHGTMPHRFEDAEEWAKRFDDPSRDAWQKPAEVVELMDIGEGMVVADIGAGTGYFLPYLSRAVGDKGQVWGLDVETTMVEYMKERATKEGLSNVRSSVVPPDDPQLAINSTDRVLIVDTWHHIAERKAYASKLAAGLKNNGSVIVVDFTMEAKHGPPPAHRLLASVIVEELASAGLEARVIEETLPDQYIVVATKPAS